MDTKVMGEMTYLVNIYFKSHSFASYNKGLSPHVILILSTHFTVTERNVHSDLAYDTIQE